MTNYDMQRLEEKVDMLIRLVARRCVEGVNKNEGILLLERLGLDRAEIAKVCDTTPRAVGARVSESRKGSRRRRTSE